MRKNENEGVGDGGYGGYVDSPIITIAIVMIKKIAKPGDEILLSVAEIEKAMDNQGNAAHVEVTKGIKDHIDAINEWMASHMAEINSVPNEIEKEIEKEISALPGFSHAKRLGRGKPFSRKDDMSMKKNETQMESEGVDVIPMTVELRTSVVAFAEAVIEGMMAGGVDGDLAIKIMASSKGIVRCIIKLKPELSIEPELMEIGNNKLAEATVSSVAFVVETICNDKVLFDNRHVICNAIRGEMINDNRSFIVADKPPKALVDDITPYTNDKRVIAAYNKMRRGLTNEKKVMKRLMSKKDGE